MSLKDLITGKIFAKDPTIIELEKLLKDAQDYVDYYRRKTTEFELKVINYKKTIEGIEKCSS